MYLGYDMTARPNINNVSWLNGLDIIYMDYIIVIPIIYTLSYYYCIESYLSLKVEDFLKLLLLRLLRKILCWYAIVKQD